MHPNRRPSGQAPFNQDPFGSPFGAFDPMAQMQQMMQQQQQMMSQMMNQHQQFVQSAFGNMAPMHASMHSAMHNPMFSAVHHQPMLSSLQHQQTAPPQRSSVRVEQVDDDTPVGIVHEPIEGPASASRPLQQRHDPVSTNVPFSGMMSGAPMMTSFSSSFMSSSTSNGSQPVVYRSSTSSRSINGVTEVQRSEFDSRTGEALHASGRKLADGRALVTESRLDRDGRQNRVDTLINLEQDQTSQFDADFRRATGGHSLLGQVPSQASSHAQLTHKR